MISCVMFPACGTGCTTCLSTTQCTVCQSSTPPLGPVAGTDTCMRELPDENLI